SGLASAIAKCSQRTARTRVPPIGKIPVSIAALRTTSHTLPMSTRESRLAEYSSVKCGMFSSLGLECCRRSQQRKRAPSPTQLGSTRVGHQYRLKSDISDFNGRGLG